MEDDSQLVNFHFITSDETYAAPTEVFSVPQTTTGTALNSMLCTCLHLTGASSPQFFFLCKKTLISPTDTLKDILRRLHLSNEQELSIEFFLPHFQQPTRLNTLPHEDAVFAITSHCSK